jgi:hypothetical protein
MTTKKCYARCLGALLYKVAFEETTFLYRQTAFGQLLLVPLLLLLLLARFCCCK